MVAAVLHLYEGAGTPFDTLDQVSRGLPPHRHDVVDGDLLVRTDAEIPDAGESTSRLRPGVDAHFGVVPHDAIDPVGFSFEADGIKISVATDLGYLPDSVRFQVRDSDVLLLEANHDLNMLKVGPYPWSVKQRVMGRMGHLSNDVACKFVRDELAPRTSTLILGHLSEHNNHPVLVEQAAAEALDGRGLFTRFLVAGPRGLAEPIVYP